MQRKAKLDPKRYLDLGNEASEEDKMTSAALYYQFSIDIYETAPEEYPDYDCAETYNELGCIHFDGKNYVRASYCYAKAISIKSSPKIHRDLGHCYHRMELYPQAIAKFTWLIENDPTDGLAFYRRGRSFECMQEIGLAIHDYSVALMLNPKEKKAAQELRDLLVGRSKESVYEDILLLPAEKAQYCLAICKKDKTLLNEFFAKDRPFFTYSLEKGCLNQTVFNTSDIESQRSMMDLIDELKKLDPVNRNRFFSPTETVSTTQKNKSKDVSIELRTNIRQNFRK